MMVDGDWFLGDVPVCLDIRARNVQTDAFHWYFMLQYLTCKKEKERRTKHYDGHLDYVT
jgi:hypothetical protein